MFYGPPIFSLMSRIPGSKRIPLPSSTLSIFLFLRNSPLSTDAFISVKSTSKFLYFAGFLSIGDRKKFNVQAKSLCLACSGSPD
jgi:hypothetical protein